MKLIFHYLNMSHAAKCAKTTTHCSFRRIQKTNKSDEPGWDLLFDAQLWFLQLQTLNNKKNLTGSSAAVFFFWYSITPLWCLSLYLNMWLCQFDLVCTEQWKQPFTNMVFFMGVVIGSFLSGPLSDRYWTHLLKHHSTHLACTACSQHSFFLYIQCYVMLPLAVFLHCCQCWLG